MSDESSQEEDLEKSKTTYQPCRNRSVTIGRNLNTTLKLQDAYKGAGRRHFFDRPMYQSRKLTPIKNGKDFHKPESVCPPSAVGVVHDDGKTFNGTRSAALQLALMLGANEDAETNCSDKEGYLLSNMTGGSLFNFLLCTKNAVSRFLKQRENKCWNRTPTPAKHNKNMLANEYYKAKHTDECRVSSTNTQEIEKCEPSEVPDLQNQNNCKVTCCPKTAEKDRSYTTNSADGTECETGKICLFGNCIPDPKSETLETKKE
uniref:Putative metalloprotease n=1 Tax=Ixodes ricinus TaxID=34613 RepID=A0A0K8RKL9_IXORI